MSATVQKVGIIGAGDLGRTIAAQLACDPAHFSVAGYFDDTHPAGSERFSLPVLGGTRDIVAAQKAGRVDTAVMAIGYKHLDARQALFDSLCEAGVTFAPIVHPSSYVHPGAHLEPGAILFPGCILDDGVRIGANTLLNTGCVVAHDTHIGAHTFLGPAVQCAGFIEIGAKCFIGVGTTIIDNVHIAAGVQTGGGAVVTSHLDVAGLYVGVPARMVRGPKDAK